SAFVSTAGPGFSELVGATPVVVAGGGGGGAPGTGSGYLEGSGGAADGIVSGGKGGLRSEPPSNPNPGSPGETAGGGGGGGGGSFLRSAPVDTTGGAGGRGADGIVVIRYLPLDQQPLIDNGGGANGGGGGSAPAAPAIVAPAPPSPAFVPGGAVPTIARAVVNGELSDLTVTPLVNQAPEGASADREAALPESFRRELPGPNGIQVTAGDVGVSLVGPQVGWPRSPDVLVVAPDVPLALQTSGFSANTEVEVFVLNQGGTWVLADTLTTGPDGTLDASVTIPEDAPVGPGYLQLDGTDASGEPISLAIGAQIAPPVAPVPTADGPLPQVTPGEASATDAEGNPLVFSIDRVEGTDVQIRVGESLTSIQALDADGLQQLAPDGAIEIEEEGFVRVGGEGFQPNSMVQVWVFSEATFVGIVLTDENGAYTSLLELPEELELGDHTLQNSGTARNGQPLAVSAGLRIIAPGEGSSAETETPETARADTTVYFGRGSSTLDSADKKKLDRLVRRVKDSAQRVRVTGYVQASSSTANDQSLSLARARSVARYLRSQGVDAKYTVRGRGVLDAPSDEARSARVTVVYTK
ncbi:MAG TPA: OmpA family protein, partial [Acidimicrobiia bacterium]